MTSILDTYTDTGIRMEYLIICLQVICGTMVVKTWDENFGDRKNNFSGSCLEGLRIIFRDSQVMTSSPQENPSSLILPFP